MSDAWRRFLLSTWYVGVAWTRKRGTGWVGHGCTTRKEVENEGLVTGIHHPPLVAMSFISRIGGSRTTPGAIVGGR